MIVGDIMVKKVHTVGPGDSLKKAQELMVRHQIRHLPVVMGRELMGIITESDIRGAFIDKRPQGASLTPSRMKVRDHMTINPMVVVPETPVEDAALIIYRNKIGALPVVRHQRLVGIVSIMDLLGLFVDMMGILHSSSRIDVVLDRNPRNFEKVSGIIHKAGLNIISVGMAPYGKSGKEQVYFFRVDLCEASQLAKKIEKAGFKVVNAVD